MAWRRREDLPEDTHEARAWLFGIARRLVLATHRVEGRAQALRVRLARPDGAPTVDGPEDAVVAGVDLMRAWDRVTASQQEVMALTVLDGLTAAQAGAILGISSTAYRLRLMRARRALSAELHLAPVQAEPVTARPCYGEAD